MPPLERRLLLPSWLLLGLARLAILLPFRWLAPWLGEHMGVTAPPDPAQVEQALAIGRSVERAARHTPWLSQCQAQAIVARVWLGHRHIPYRIQYGVRRLENGQLAAHAWVCVADTVITGSLGYERFAVVGSFSSTGKRPPNKP